MHRLIQKLFFLILILSVVVSFSACGETSQENSEIQTSESVSNTKTDIAKNQDFITDTSSETDQTSSDSTDVVTDHSSDTITTNSTTDRPSDTETVTDSKNTDAVTNTSTNRPSDPEPETVTDSKQTDTVTNTSTTTDSSVSSTVTSDSTTDTSVSVDANTTPELPPTPVVNTSIPPISPENYFGIQWLSSQENGNNLVKSYQELVAGIGGLQEEIPLSTGISEKELHTVWYCFQADYPQYFWLGDKFEYYQKNKKVTRVVPTYTLTKNELPAAQNSFNQAVERLLAGINSSMTQYEIEKTIHDRLVLHCTYQDATNSHNSYGALVNGTAVCEGITKAFQHLCRSVGIEALFVFGKSCNPTSGEIEGHSWNIVKIDKNYYHIDVTWDNAGEPEEDEMHYAWFNLPTQWISEDHVLAQLGYAYPNCTETKENFFTKNDGRLSYLSIEEIVKRTIKHGDDYFFRAYMTDTTIPSQWMEQNGSALAERLGLNGYRYEIITVGHEVTILMSNYKG